MRQGREHQVPVLARPVAERERERLVLHTHAGIGNHIISTLIIKKKGRWVLLLVY